MPARRKIPEDIQKQVRQLANYLCEYCHASEQWQYVAFTIDHVIPLTTSGADTIDNLALACFHCNRKKSGKTTAIDHTQAQKCLCLTPDNIVGANILFGRLMDYQSSV
jgi:5-methylcytosine-specific restriction endonuclease McrA